jgi:hypothetical protein
VIKQKDSFIVNTEASVSIRRDMFHPGYLPLSAGALDTRKATARSSSTDTMTGFMTTVLLSGQQAVCFCGSRRRDLYREVSGGSGKCDVQYLVCCYVFKFVFPPVKKAVCGFN